MPCCSPPLCRHARTPPRHPATHAAAPSDPRTGWRRQARARWAARAARPSARRHEGWRHAPTRASPPQVTQSAPNPRFGSGPARCAAPRFQRRPDEVAVAGAPSATRPHAGPSRPRSTASSERPAGSRRVRLPLAGQRQRRAGVPVQRVQVGQRVVQPAAERACAPRPPAP